jgi:hypothetical protein
LRSTRRFPCPPEDPYSTAQLGKALYAMACELSLTPALHRQAPSQKKKEDILA